jgi:hypothetical protein
MKSLFAKTLLFVFIISSWTAAAHNKKNVPGYYKIIIYNFKTEDQQKVLGNYLKNAYLPALHSLQINNIGVFTPLTNDTAVNKCLYVIIPLKSLKQAATLAIEITSNKQYLANAKTYLEAAYSNPPYTRMETILLEQFSMAPFFNLPKLKSSNAEKIYELRSYESATENIFANKVEMFNEGGEIKLFDRLNFNAVFYARVIAGGHMPNLMYMTSFENMNDREEHWKEFVASEEWKKLSTLPYYQNNVSKIDITFLKATDYSDY